MSDGVFVPLLNTSVSVSAASAPISIAVPMGTTADTIRLANSTSAVVMVRWGTGAQTAVATDLALLAGTVETFYLKPSDSLAAICPSGTGTLYVSIGGGR